MDFIKYNRYIKYQYLNSLKFVEIFVFWTKLIPLKVFHDELQKFASESSVVVPDTAEYSVCSTYSRNIC